MLPFTQIPYPEIENVCKLNDIPIISTGEAYTTVHTKLVNKQLVLLTNVVLDYSIALSFSHLHLHTIKSSVISSMKNDDPVYLNLCLLLGITKPNKTRLLRILHYLGALENDDKLSVFSEESFFPSAETSLTLEISRKANTDHPGIFSMLPFFIELRGGTECMINRDTLVQVLSHLNTSTLLTLMRCSKGMYMCGMGLRVSSIYKRLLPGVLLPVGKYIFRSTLQTIAFSNKHKYWIQDGKLVSTDTTTSFRGNLGIVHIHSNGDLLWIVTSTGKVFSNVTTSAPPLKNTYTSKLTSIVQVSSSRSNTHMLYLSASGKVYASGDNNYSKTGLIGSTKTPKQVPGLKGITQIVASGSYSVMLDADSFVYTIGTWINASGVVVNKRKMDGVIQIAGCSQYYYTLNNRGEVCCTKIPIVGEPQMQRINSLKDIVQISGTGNYLLALDNVGDVYLVRPLVEKISNIRDVVEILARSNIGMVRYRNGDTYKWDLSVDLHTGI